MLPGEEIWLIETKGTSEAPGNAVGDRACFGERPQKARIVGTVTFSHAERYADVTAFRADVSNHCICEGGDKDWDGSGERYAWRIASVSALQEPLVDPVKTQTGIPAPATFEVVFSARDRRPRQVDAEVAYGTSAEAESAQSPGASSSCRESFSMLFKHAGIKG